jgi:single-strand DNA-binding protein
MVNKVFLIGNLGRDPEIFTKRGTACRMAVATTEKYDGNEKTEWHNVVAFNAIADACGKYLRKGSKVFVEGKLVTEAYTDKEGIKINQTKVFAHKVQFLDSKPQQQQPQNGYMPKNNSRSVAGGGDEIPF